MSSSPLADPSDIEFSGVHADNHAGSTDPRQSGSAGQFPMSRARQARVDLLERIRAFFLKHDLNVTGSNLSAVGTALSGANAALGQAFVAREISGDPIDQRWLDTVVRLDPETGARMNELEKLMDRMEYTLMRFAQTAKSAHDETSEHRGALDALDAQLQQLSGQESEADEGEPRGDVSRVIELSHAMLNRISQVEYAMERSQAETDQLRANLAEARIEADVDHLTRLPNRRAFERRLASAAVEAQQSGEPLCLAFCDVDHFKTVNDVHGHDAGDRVLMAIATVLNSHASDTCFVARHGGEEFVLLFYGVDKDAAWRQLDGVRRIQERKQMINRETGKLFGKITFSAGIAQVMSVEDTRDAMARADRALYQAKNGGRNRIELD